MKSRVLYFSGKGKMRTMAAALAQKMQTKEDVVPPAYSCDKEKILFLGVSAAKNMEDAFVRFCDGLNPTKAVNVALFVDGKPENVKPIVDRITAAGAKVCDNVFYCSFKLFGGVSDADKQALLAWGDEIVAGLQ